MIPFPHLLSILPLFTSFSPLFTFCSSPPHLLVRLYLSFSSSNFFSICLSIPISFFTSQWLRDWQFAWCLDSWSSVLAIWNCPALTFTTTSVHTRLFWSSLGDPIPSTLLFYPTLEGSFSSHPILVDMFSSKLPVKAQKCGPLLSLPLKLGFWFVNWDKAAVEGLFWIRWMRFDSDKEKGALGICLIPGHFGGNAAKTPSVKGVY